MMVTIKMMMVMSRRRRRRRLGAVWARFYCTSLSCSQ